MQRSASRRCCPAGMPWTCTSACWHSAPDAPLFVLHDGPPYANGHMHMGHVLNQRAQGHRRQVQAHERAPDAPTCPGWDCHGLPIELQVEKEVGRAKKAELPVVEVRRLCDAYARKFVGIQRDEFRRLGVVGDWEQPVLDPGSGLRGAGDPRARQARQRRAPLPRGRSRCTGARRARPRWPRPRSSTRTSARTASTSSSRWLAATRPRRCRWRCSARRARVARRAGHARRAQGGAGRLDDDAVDAAGEPRAVAPSRARVRRVARRRRAADRRRGPGRRLPRRVGLHEDAGIGARALRRRASSRASSSRHPWLERRVPVRARRLRHARGRHRPGPHRARPRPGGLRGRAALRARRLLAGRRARPVHRRRPRARRRARLRRQPEDRRAHPRARAT